MKKEKIRTLFRKERRLNLYNKMYFDDGEKKLGLQYVSDGFVVYPLENLPEFDETTLPSFLDVPKELPTKYDVLEAPDWLYTAIKDFDDSDIPLRKHMYDVFGYTVFQTFHNSPNDKFEEVTIFADPKYLAPIADEACEFLLRNLDNGRRVIVAQDGLLTKAIILPMDFSSDSLIEDKIEFVKSVYTKLTLMRNKQKADEEQSTLL